MTAVSRTPRRPRRDFGSIRSVLVIHFVVPLLLFPVALFMSLGMTERLGIGFASTGMALSMVPPLLTGLSATRPRPGLYAAAAALLTTMPWLVEWIAIPGALVTEHPANRVMKLAGYGVVQADVSLHFWACAQVAWARASWPVVLCFLVARLWGDRSASRTEGNALRRRELTVSQSAIGLALLLLLLLTAPIAVVLRTSWLVRVDFGESKECGKFGRQAMNIQANRPVDMQLFCRSLYSESRNRPAHVYKLWRKIEARVDGAQIMANLVNTMIRDCAAGPERNDTAAWKWLKHLLVEWRSENPTWLPAVAPQLCELLLPRNYEECADRQWQAVWGQLARLAPDQFRSSELADCLGNVGARATPEQRIEMREQLRPPSDALPPTSRPPTDSGKAWRAWFEAHREGLEASPISPYLLQFPGPD